MLQDIPWGYSHPSAEEIRYVSPWESVLCSPAEFDAQEAIWLAWSFDSAKKGYPYYEAHLAIINALHATSKVHILVKNQEELRMADELIKIQCPLSGNIAYFIIPTSTIWVRDTGPTFVAFKSNRSTGIVQFAFNQWGYGSESDDSFDYLVASKIAQKIDKPLLKSAIVSEGGNREVNGRGVLIVVEEVELARNPGKTKMALTREYEKVLGVTQVIWLKQGLCEDQNPTRGLLPGPDGKSKYYTPLTPGGHIDAFCRFVGSRTILLAEVPPDDLLNNPVAQENARRLEESFKVLSNARDQDGMSFEIVRIPTAPCLLNMFIAGDTFYEYLVAMRFPPTEAFPEGRFPDQNEYPFYLTTSYMNFLITNNCVISAKYWKEGLPDTIKERDEKAYAILQKVFVDKKIVLIDAYNLNLAGGGVHCVTQHQPK